MTWLRPRLLSDRIVGLIRPMLDSTLPSLTSSRRRVCLTVAVRAKVKATAHYY